MEIWKKYSKGEIDTSIIKELSKYRKVDEILNLLSEQKRTKVTDIAENIGLAINEYQDLLSILEKIGAIKIHEIFQEEYVPTPEIWYLDEQELKSLGKKIGSRPTYKIVNWIIENPHKSYSVESLERIFNIHRPFGKQIINIEEKDIERVLSLLEKEGYLKSGKWCKNMIIESNIKLIKLILELFEEESGASSRGVKKKHLIYWGPKIQFDPAKKDYLLRTIKEGLDGGMETEKIAKGLSQYLNLQYDWVKTLIDSIEKLLKDPEKGSEGLLTRKERHVLYKLGLKINEIREFYGLEILYKKYGDMEKIYEIIKERPLTNEEIEKLKMGKASASALISSLKRLRHLNINPLFVPFTPHDSMVYYLPEQKKEAIEIARKKALKKYESALKGLREKGYKIDGKAGKAIKNIILKDQISEDDPNIKILKENYVGLYSYLLKMKTFKSIVKDGITYYSFWGFDEN